MTFKGNTYRVRFHARVCHKVCLELVGSIESSCAISKRTFILLDWIVCEQVSLQLVSSIESSCTCCACEWFLARMYDHVHFEIVSRLESLVTITTRVNILAVGHEMASKISLTWKHFGAMLTLKVMRRARLMIVQSFLRTVPA